jgi:hypothetical protein
MTEAEIRIRCLEIAQGVVLSTHEDVVVVAQRILDFVNGRK